MWQHRFTATQPRNTPLKFTESPLGLWDGPEHLPGLSLWGLPVHPMGQEAVAKGALATCAHCAITPRCGVGTRGTLPWGGPHQLSSHPIPSQGPTPARVAKWASHLCHPAPCFRSWRGLGAVELPRALAYPWREAAVQILLAGAVGAAGVMLQPWHREDTSSDISVSKVVTRSPMLCPCCWCQTWTLLCRAKGFSAQCPWLLLPVASYTHIRDSAPHAGGH